jgi:hypothetical protein
LKKEDKTLTKLNVSKMSMIDFWWKMGKLRTDNEESEKITIELDDSFDDTNRQFIWRVQNSEVKKLCKWWKRIRSWDMMTS